MTDTAPVDDWSSDYDIFDEGYVNDPFPIWDDIRESGCPIARTERWGQSWLPTKFEDVQALAKMVPALSSRDPLVVRPPEGAAYTEQMAKYGGSAPPISADPPLHNLTRRPLLPHFSPKAVETHRAYTEDLCNQLIDGFIDTGRVDAAAGYAQQIPPRVIAHKLGIDESRVDDFVFWVRNVLEFGLTKPELRAEYRVVIRDFFHEMVAERRENPGDDLISALMQEEINGEPIEDEVVVGMCNLQLVAGIDTTWSSIGSAIWHLATHESDRRWLASEPELLNTAVEELLRAYAPVTMAREVIEPVTYNGAEMQVGDKVLMNFPGACRDPEIFEDPDKVILDRQRNRHVAFGSGIHRCAGSNLARLEMQVALGIWMARIPEFRLEDDAHVTWAGGQVRGPRSLPIVFPT